MSDFLAFASTYLSLHVGGFALGPLPTTLLLLAVIAGLLSAFHLWRIGQQEDRLDRLETLRGAAVYRMPQAARPRWYTRIGGLVASSPIIGGSEQQRLLGILAAAGIKGHGSLSTFFAVKVCGAALLVFLVWVLLEWRQMFASLALVRLALMLGSLMLGWRLPDLVLGRLAARRRKRIERGLPDALDLLVICTEAGLSLDQAIEEVGRDLRHSHPEIAEEFVTTSSEMRVLPNRADALDNLVQRTKLPSLRSVTATLTQAVRFGTPLAESMRILAAAMRIERMAQLEARAARLPVLLAIPMMLFILPSLLIVIGTPVVVRILDTMRHVFGTS